MVKIEFDMNPKLFFQNIFELFKKKRSLQLFTGIITLLLISMPVHSYYLESIIPANAHERENMYFIDAEDGGIAWIAETSREFSNQETFSILMDETQFPEEAKEMNIVAVYLSVYVMDSEEDNEDTSGLGCLANDGQDAPDSVSVVMDHPSAESVSFTTESSTWGGLELFTYPKFETYPFIQGYTVEEIEELFDTSEEVIGEYSINITANVESGDSTFECEREDSSVTIQYQLTLSYFDVQVVEWIGPI